MNKKDRAILYGLAIGDGHISYRTRLKDGKYRYEQAELMLGHGPQQKRYLEWKAELLQKIFGGKLPKVSEKHYTSKTTGKTYLGYAAAKTAVYFRQMHRVLYSEDKKKIITDQVLSYLDDFSLALWFMDDGNIIHNTSKDGNITSIFFRITTQVTEEEADRIVLWLRTIYQIEAKKYLSKGKWDIGGGTSATLKLSEVIIDHIHPDLFYKFKSVAKLTICKSDRHPLVVMSAGDDIVRTVENTIGSVTP